MLPGRRRRRLRLLPLLLVLGRVLRSQVALPRPPLRVRLRPAGLDARMLTNQRDTSHIYGRRRVAVLGPGSWELISISSPIFQFVSSYRCTSPPPLPRARSCLFIYSTGQLLPVRSACLDGSPGRTRKSVQRSSTPVRGSDVLAMLDPTTNDAVLVCDAIIGIPLPSPSSASISHTNRSVHFSLSLSLSPSP